MNLIYGFLFLWNALYTPNFSRKNESKRIRRWCSSHLHASTSSLNQWYHLWQSTMHDPWIVYNDLSDPLLQFGSLIISWGYTGVLYLRLKNNPLFTIAIYLQGSTNALRHAITCIYHYVPSCPVTFRIKETLQHNNHTVHHDIKVTYPRI